jgi:hypothetical protein
MPGQKGRALLEAYTDLGWNPPVSADSAEAALLARLTQTLTITDYGADPTGTNDSTVAINAAIAALGTRSLLHFPAGTFLINSALNAIPANCTVSGAGEGSTLINTPLASGTLFNFTGANSNIYNITLNNTVSTNAATGITLAASQVTATNVTVLGFANGITMTSAATFANIVNGFIGSTVSNAIGMTVAGSDTLIDGVQFNGTGGSMTGMVCASSDRFAVVDCVYEQCTIGISMSATSATGTTTFGGLAFNTCGTGFSITPGTGQTVQEVVVDGCTAYTSTTAGISISPTLTGVVKNVVLDGCAAEAGGAAGIVVAAAGTGSITNLTIEGCIATGNTTSGITLSTAATACTLTNVVIADCICSGNTTTGLTIAFGATSTLSNVVVDGCVFASNTTYGTTLTTPASMTNISFVNCIYASNTTAAFLPTPGGASSLGTVAIRECPGITGTFSPIGTQPGFPNTTVVQANNTGLDIMAYITNGTSAMTVVKGGPAGTTTFTGFTPQASVSFSMLIPAGQSVAFTYAGGTPTWSWVN